MASSQPDWTSMLGMLLQAWHLADEGHGCFSRCLIVAGCLKGLSRRFRVIVPVFKHNCLAIFVKNEDRIAAIHGVCLGALGGVQLAGHSGKGIISRRESSFEAARCWPMDPLSAVMDILPMLAIFGHCLWATGVLAVPRGQSWPQF
ncbi:unnamed protein product [Ostreobium quekettii]|uniref:Uncharacterized protein n=1 Tax=Ostreobium quekettii TaxID=121088 RepID=A0A8S1JC28_9CHLO|nr:unnamed protein product [Ostreobium quekettii]